MSSKKEEERNEKVIRGLMKLPPNRRCINCNSLGPQYVCTNFWTFVCIACSGIHREFTHRVKSVSMAKFTTQEVEALQRGGNQRAREQFLNDWDTQRMRLPNNSNPDKIREFIKSVYVDKKYAGSKSSDKPPRDTQSLKGEEDHRRASSYHSFSQSPPYDNQYEDRRYGRQAGTLTRKPGSDRGHYEGKMSSFLYSPGREGEQIYEDRFANEASGSRISDYSVSSDPFRYSGQSPNFNDPAYVSPSSQVRDILVEDARPQNLSTSSESVKEDINRIPCRPRSASSGSFGSFGSNSFSVKSANLGSLIDSVPVPAHASGIQHADTSTFPNLPHQSSAANTKNIDLFNQEFVPSQNTSLTPSIDLFAEVSQLPSTMQPKGQNSTEIPPSDNVGWATFDFPLYAEPPKKENQVLPSVVPLAEKDAPKGNTDLFSSTHNNSDWFSVQNLDSQGLSSLVADQWSMGLNEVKGQLWNAFPDSAGYIPQILSGIPPQHGESQDLLQRPPLSIDPFVGFKAPETTLNGGFLNPAIDDKAPAVSTLTDIASSSFPQSRIPQMGLTTLDRKTSNPFDLPYDLETEGNNMFMDMSSLQAALPEPQLQLPGTFPGGLPDPWFPADSFSSFIPPVPQGGLAYIGGQVPGPQLQNIPSQGPVASIGGNPFA